MRSNNLGRTLALGVIAIAAFNTFATFVLPARVARPTASTIAVVNLLLATHAVVYWFGDRIRGRLHLARYVGIQAALIFGVGLLGSLFPVGLGLLMAFTAEAIHLARGKWGAVLVILGAIVVFVVNAALVSDLYRAASAGLVLVITGVVAHAIAGLMDRETATAPASASIGPSDARDDIANAAGLTARELEVLKGLVSGARSTQIAAQLGITERTVKAHLGSIYKKLGVESRAAAVAFAVQRRLV